VDGKPTGFDKYIVVENLNAHMCKNTNFSGEAKN
jgi:hypothetical protein